MTEQQYLNYQEADEFIRAFEAEADLLRFQVDGWCVWPLLRMSANLMLQATPYGPLRRSRWERLWLGLRGLPRLALLPRKRWLISTFSSARMEKSAGRFVDVFFDELLVGTQDWFKIEWINNPAFRERGRNCLLKSQMYVDPLTLLISLLERSGRQPAIERTAAELSAALRRVPRFAAFTTEYVARLLTGFHWDKRVWGWIMRRMKPQCLLRANCGEYPSTAAAKELGIEVIEFQHGMIDRFSPAYSWPSYALSYKRKMPLPDRLLLYGPYFQEQLAAHGFWGETLRPVGCLRMDGYRRLRLQRLEGEKVPALLVTTQGLDREQLIAFLLQFLEHCKNRLDLRLNIKLHPAYDADKAPYTRAFGSHKNVSVYQGNEEPSTFELLCEARWHASISSSCHYDALGLGVPTIILPLSTHEIVDHLHAQGLALLPGSPQELAELLRDERSGACPKDCSSLFYTRDALSNIKRELGV